MTTSDADLGARILAGWERITRAVDDGPRLNRRLAEHFGIGLREIEHLRDTRNRVAHPDTPVPRDELERAVATVRRVDRRAAKREPAEPSKVTTPEAATKPQATTEPANTAKRAEPKDPRFGEITITRETTRLGRVWNLAEDYWIALGTVLVGLPAAIVGLVNLGPIGLLVGPLVVAGGVGVLVAVALAMVPIAWVAGILAAVASPVYAIVQFVQGDPVEGFVFLGVSAIIAAGYLAWEFR